MLGRPRTIGTWLPDQPGIYAIVHVASGREYIGSTTVGIRTRWRRHHWGLVHQVHGCRQLQFAWDKYGEDAFGVEALEIVTDRTILIEREQYHIDRVLQRGRRALLNGAIRALPRESRPHSSITRAKMSESAFRIWQNDDRRAQASQRSKEMWRTPGFAERFWQIRAASLRESGKPGAPVKTVEGIRAPDGTEYRNITNVAAFAIQHNLLDNAIRNVIAGRKSHHHGWTRLDSGLRFPTFLSPDGEKHGPIPELAAFARQHSLDLSCLLRVAKGKQEKHHGWRLADAE